MSKYLKVGKGIKVTCAWGDGEICATYKHRTLENGVRQFRIRTAPGCFIDLGRSEFDLAEPIIKFTTIKKLFDTEFW